MKKKVLSVALVVVLLAIMVGGTLAYFTAGDKVTNTFTIGSVKIEIYENDNATTRDTIFFGKLTPIVNTTDPSKDANYIKKEVSVKNIGANDAYIRTHIAIPTKLVGYLVPDLNLSADGWTQVGEAVQTGDYTVYTYDYINKVGAAAFTPKLLKGVYLDEDVDLKEDADGNLVFCIRKADGSYDYSGYIAHPADGSESQLVSILVASEAIQAQRFEEGANAATNALNAGFGAGTNPWQP